MSYNIFRKHPEVPPQHKNQYLLRSIKSGLSKAFSNVQGSGMRQLTILSSNCHICQSSSAYQLRHAMMCLQRLRRALWHLRQDDTVGRAQNNLRKEDSGSGKAGSGHFLPQGEDGHFLLWSEDVGKREFSGKVRAATNVAATCLAATDFITYNFTEITITTPPLTRILDRLIGGGIILCGDVVRHGVLWPPQHWH